MFITEDKIETASLFKQKVGEVLAGTMSHVTISEGRKTPYMKGRVKDINNRKVY